VYLSLQERSAEYEIVPSAIDQGLGLLIWSPLAGGWLSGKYRKDGESPGSSRRAQMMPSRYDMSLAANQAKLEAVDAFTELAEQSGMTLIELALAFVTTHPAVTAAIIGPRTIEQLDSQLPALARTLDGPILDRIDEVVAPGTNVKPDERGWDPPWLTDSALRRR
jgi:aryl-alcohol dehydrogenase-like predicted oxidoreductase